MADLAENIKKVEQDCLNLEAELNKIKLELDKQHITPEERSRLQKKEEIHTELLGSLVKLLAELHKKENLLLKAAQGSGPVQQDPFERFKRLLDPEMTDEKVLQRVFLYYPTHVQVASNRQQATTIYNKAALLPGSSTKLRARQNNGLIINGDYLPNVPSRSALVHAFLDCKPMLLKLPCDDKGAQLEFGVWSELSSSGAPPNLAGPLSLVRLQEHDGKLRDALLMPLYQATLQHAPCITPATALAYGQHIQTGLQHMHQHNLAHCDVKAANIFIDGEGQAYLGDYGAVRKFGEDVDEKTASHVPVDAAPQLDVDKASAALDRCLLAVTLLERLGNLHLGQRGEQLHMSDITTALQRVSDVALHAFLLSMLP